MFKYQYLDFDCETHNAGKEFGMHPDDFVRLIQYSVDGGEAQFTTDRQWFIDNIIEQSRYICGHNIISADLGWLYGQDSFRPVRLAQERRVIDSFVIASLVTPAPEFYTTSTGRRATTFSQGRQKPELVMKYLALDNLAHQFGLPGKMGDLQALAKKHNPKGTLVANLNYGLIPLDDPEFMEYAGGDIIAGKALREFLFDKIKEIEYSGEYIWRELLVASLSAQIRKNGVTINRGLAEARVAELEAQRGPIMEWLVKEYDFPTTGKQPWKTDLGKAAIMKVLADFGITPETHPEWEKTKTGNLSLGGKVLLELTEGTEAEKFGESMSILMGQRSLAQLALDSIYEDGLAHPKVSSLQRSGRWSFTEPGLTVWTKNEEKKYIVAAEGKVFAELDFNAADARAMAGLSGDPEFIKRFEVDEDGNPLRDAHNETGVAAFGEDVYYGDGPRDAKARPILRAPSKVVGHGSNYNIGNFKLANNLNKVCEKEGIDLHFWAPRPEWARKAGIPEIERREDSISVPAMMDRFKSTFAWLTRFKEQAVAEGESGWVTNSWGRKMPVDKGRSHTQSPALYGQSTTREMMADALIRMLERGEKYVRAIKAIIHDALLVELDEATAKEDAIVVKECMEAVFDPKTPVGTAIDFPVGIGPLAKDWWEASHE